LLVIRRNADFNPPSDPAMVTKYFLHFRIISLLMYYLRYRALLPNFALAGELMDRRTFLKSATATGLTVGLLKASANASIPEHNWDKYDWGSGPARLFPRAMSR
jgi:hypothetical protein